MGIQDCTISQVMINVVDRAIAPSVVAIVFNIFFISSPVIDCSFV